VIFDVLICMLILLAVQLVSPYWWWVMVVPFLYALIKGQSASRVFLVGMVSSGLIWLTAGLYYWQTGGELIVERMTALLALPASWMLLAGTAAIAVVVGGIGALSGFYLKSLWKK
jgi:hypothetical protein